MIKIANAHDYHGPGVYVGRHHPRFPQGSPLSNPYHVGKDGSRGLALAKYHAWLRQQWRAGGPAKDELLRLADAYRQSGELTLVCWCAPAACHAEIVAQVVHELAAEAEPNITSSQTWLLITGSREATPEMLAYAHKAVARAQARGWSVIVGDAEGVDAAVIAACDELGLPVEVHGANSRLRRRTRAGKHVVHKERYLARDRAMVARADVALAVWNGRSRGTQYTFEYAQTLGKEVHVREFRDG